MLFFSRALLSGERWIMALGALWITRAVGQECLADHSEKVPLGHFNLWPLDTVLIVRLFSLPFKVLIWKIKEGCAGLGPSGVILDNTLLDRFRVKGTSSEGNSYAYIYNDCIMIFRCIRTSRRIVSECYSGRGLCSVHGSLAWFFFNDSAYGAFTRNPWTVNQI